MLKAIPLIFLAFPAQAQSFLCGGAEPFWSLEISTGTANFNSPEQPDITLEIAHTAVAAGRSWPKGFTLLGPRMSGIALLHERACNDTTADITYSHSIDFLTQDGLEPVILTGCCRLKP